MTNFRKYSGHIVSNLLHENPIAYLMRPLHGEPLKTDFPIDVREKNGSYIVQAELPGAKKEDVIVTVDGDHFTIAAEIDQYDQKAEGEKIIQSERYFGSVRRTVRLPSMLDKSLSVAHFDNGILKLELAKERNKGSKNLEIK